MATITDLASAVQKLTGAVGGLEQQDRTRLSQADQSALDDAVTALTSAADRITAIVEGPAPAEEPTPTP